MSKNTKAEKQAAMNKTGAETKSVPVVNHAEEKATTTAKAEKVAEEKAPKEPGKIAKILEMFKAGSTPKEIEDAGFHKTTISIQVSKYKKAHPDLYPPKEKAPKQTAEEKQAIKDAAKAAKKAEKEAAKEKAAPVAATV